MAYGDREDQDARQDGADDQRIEPGSAQGCHDGSRSGGYLYDETPQGDELKLFIAVEQRIGNDGGGSKK